MITITKAQETAIINVYRERQQKVYNDDTVADEICFGTSVAVGNARDDYSRGYDNGCYAQLKWIADLLKIDVDTVQENTTFQFDTNLPNNCDIQKIKEEFADIISKHGGEIVTVFPAEDANQEATNPADNAKIHRNNLKQFNDEPKIRCIAYGQEHDEYFVQGCCNEPHLGQKCGCHNFGEHLSKEEAEKLANEKAKFYNVPIEKW